MNRHHYFLEIKAQLSVGLRARLPGNFEPACLDISHSKHLKISASFKRGCFGDPSAMKSCVVAKVLYRTQRLMLYCTTRGPQVWFARQYPAHHPNTLLLDNALATMGAGLPSAIAAKLMRPKETVMAVVGDGGFMMASQELITAVSLGVHITVVIVNDNAYGMIKWKQVEFP
jgi:thiamine pyrophosphate-dependent acetolactate synthase large subunit-like protein